MRVGKIMRWLAVLLAAVLLGFAWQLSLERETLRDVGQVSAPLGTAEVSAPEADDRPVAALAQAHEHAARRAVARDLDRARRDALRERILERERTRSVTQDTQRERADDDEDAPTPEVGQLADRIGGRDALLGALNHDFMPLAGECIEQAIERAPELRGMLALELELVADAELGAVIDTAKFPERNEVHDDALLECIRETALSTSLPPPPEGGREAFMLTMPVGEPTAAEL